MSEKQNKNIFELAEEQLVQEAINSAKGLIGGAVVAVIIGLYNRRETFFSRKKK